MSNGGWSEKRSAKDALQAAQDGKLVLCMGVGAFWDSDRRCLCSGDSGAPIVINLNTLGDVWSIQDQLDAETNIHHGDDPEGAEVRAHMVAGGRARDMSAHVPSPYRYCRGLMEYRADDGVWCESVRHLWEMPFTGAEWEIIPLEKSKPECWDFAGQPGLILYRTGLCSPLCYRQNGGIMEYIDVHHHPEEKWYVSSDWAVEAPNKVQFREATREEVAKLPDLTDEQRKRYNIPAEAEPQKVRTEIAGRPYYEDMGYINSDAFRACVSRRGCVIGIEFHRWPEAVRGKGKLFTASNGIRVESWRSPILGLFGICLPGGAKNYDGKIAQYICDTPAEAETLAAKVVQALKEFAAWCDEHYEASDQ